jgi:hypothetical protein
MLCKINSGTAFWQSTDGQETCGYFMQDSATAHIANNCMNVLAEGFGDEW